MKKCLNEVLKYGGPFSPRDLYPVSGLSSPIKIEAFLAYILMLYLSVSIGPLPN